MGGMAGASEATEPSESARDALFHVLSNRRRRLVLYCLHEYGEDGIRSLSTRVAAMERDVDPDAVTYDQRKSVYASLHQNHLPKLEEAGYIESGNSWSDVRLTERGENLDVFLGVAQSTADRWHLVYGSLAVLGFLLVTAVALRVRPFGLLSWQAIALLVTVSLGTVAVVHVYYRRTKGDGALPGGGDGPP